MEINSDIVKKRLIIFTALSIAIGWATIFVIPVSGIRYEESVAMVILAAMMFSPAISSILTRIITKEGFKDMYLKPNLKGNIRKYLAVFFGPSILLLISCVIYFFIFPNNFDAQFNRINDMLAVNGPKGLTAGNMLVISILQIIFLGPLINIIPTLGEEVGWRGYLLPKLRKLLNDRPAVIVTGVIWGFWHLPAIVMGHNYGKDYLGYPWMGIIAMIIFCVILGIIEGYATIRLNSVIPAAMIHSTVNAGASLPILIAKEGYNTLIGPAITGLVGGIPFIVLAGILYFRLDNLRQTD
ncbi:MAG TPA: type II CAAX endopeptidase family protein [Anaerovoracaceae bacterium]|nr:type II CAAX endopeptidase family protein [Anaerovoracaceae bacterium]